MRMPTDPDRRLRLPVWAQAEIEDLGHTIRNLGDENLRLRQIIGSIESSDTAIHAGYDVGASGGYVWHRVPSGTQVRFALSGTDVGDRGEDWIDVRVVGGVLHVGGGGQIMVRPRASNVVYVECAPR